MRTLKIVQTTFEISVRQRARQDYRKDTFRNTYPKGSIASLIYIDEQQAIKFEEDQHGS